MTGEVFNLVDGITTRQVNAAFREAIDAGLKEWSLVLPDAKRDERVEVRKPFVGLGQRADVAQRRYIYGIYTPLRSTLIGHYIVGTGQILVVWPNTYYGIDHEDPYTRMRVWIRDRIVHSSGIRKIEGAA